MAQKRIHEKISKLQHGVPLAPSGVRLDHPTIRRLAGHRAADLRELAARNPLMPREERQEQRPRNGGQKGEEGVRVGGVPGDGLRT